MFKWINFGAMVACLVTMQALYSDHGALPSKVRAPLAANTMTNSNSTASYSDASPQQPYTQFSSHQPAYYNQTVERAVAADAPSASQVQSNGSSSYGNQGAYSSNGCATNACAPAACAPACAPACATNTCPPDQPCSDQACNDCWCLYVHYEPCYYCVNRCVEEQVPCKKQCVRYVNKCYEVQRCKYVPQYYTETYTRQEPEYYCVDDCKTVQKTVQDVCCKNVPRYYWKHVCGNANCTNPCPR